MRTGTYRLKKRVGKTAVYGQVTITVDITDWKGSSFPKVITDSNIPEQWRIPAQFGVVYALEHLPRDVQYRVKEVRVTEVNAYVVDSTSIVIAYVACLAFLNAIDNELSTCRPIFLEDGCNFSFPK